MGVAAAAIDGGLLRREQGLDAQGKARLRRGLHECDGLLMQRPFVVPPSTHSFVRTSSSNTASPMCASARDDMASSSCWVICG